MNPLGWRPWGSRLEGYSNPNKVLQRRKKSSGGLGTVELPNFATFARDRDWVARETYLAPQPRIYVPPELAPSRPSRAGKAGRWVFTPALPPSRTTETQNAISYRVDPSTGQYKLYDSDIVPRGVWQQNTFQPRAPRAFTALGQEVEASGDVRIQLPDGQTVSVKTSPPPGKSARAAGRDFISELSANKGMLLLGGLALLALMRGKR